MKYLDYESVKEKISIHFYTGNGPRDRRIIERFAHKYNGPNIVLFSASSPSIIATRGLTSTTGLHGIFEALKLDISKFNIVGRILIMVDKEHTMDSDPRINEQDKIKQSAKNKGFYVIDINPIGQGVYFMEVSVGSRNLEIHISIMGHSRYIEENMAALINLRYGKSISGTKEEVNSTLHQLRINDATLINGATKAELNTTFPSLTKAISDLESVFSN